MNSPPGALFDVHRVAFSYPDRQVLNGITFTLSPGRFYALLGPNGSGKTTLLDLLFGHKHPDSGRITFQGRDLHTYSHRETARHIALVPQNESVNFPFSVREVVAMGRYPHLGRFQPLSGTDQELVERTLDQTGIRHLASRPVTELSGGEKQRVLFARALAQAPSVLLLDEATSNLDIKHGLQLMGLTRRLVHSRELTVLAVFQDINLAAAFCDRLIFLSQGRVHTFGPPAEALTARTIAAVFEVRSRVRFDAYTGAHQVTFKP